RRAAGGPRRQAGSGSGGTAGVVRPEPGRARTLPEGRGLNGMADGRGRNGSAGDYDPFAGGALAGVVPTTEPQRELWLAAQLGEDASLAYNESVSLQLRGPLDVARLQRALQLVVDRHDALRASFGPDGETFCVLEPAPLPLEVVDLSQLPQAGREAALAQRRRAGVETAFALAQGRLFRAELLKLSPQEHVLLMHAHHIVCDGWSWWVLVRELGTAYARGDEAASALPPAESFADYALAEAMRPGSPGSVEDEQYWLSRFAGAPPVLDLPTDRPRPARRTFSSRREDYVLDAELVSAVRRMAAVCCSLRRPAVICCGAGCSSFSDAEGRGRGLSVRLRGPGARPSWHSTDWPPTRLWGWLIFNDKFGLFSSILFIDGFVTS